MANRDTQGSFNSIVPPFSAPPEGTPSYKGVNKFGRVQASATGPLGKEAEFALDYSLDAGNTALPGGTFFVENRVIHLSPRFGELSDGGAGGTAVSGATSGSAGRVDFESVLMPWLLYARGFTNGGLTGTTYANTPIVGTTTSYQDVAGNILTDLYIHPMDLPTVPYGSYEDLPGYSTTRRTNNKVLDIRGTGETFSANFRAANTDMLFNINHVPGSLGVNTFNPPRTLSVQTGTNREAVTFNGGTQWDQGTDVGSALDRNPLNRFNRIGHDLLSSSEYVINPTTDLMFFFNYSNRSDSNATNPIGNVLKCTFPVPVRGIFISQLDANVDSPPFNLNSVHRSSRIFVEGDFVDGTTFTYVMFGRGGPAPENVNNSFSAMSYLALNSRTDKHIKTIYISNVHNDPMQNSPPGHIDHGIIDEKGPGRFYANGQQSGDSGSYHIMSGIPSDTLGTGPSFRDQDDIVIKINVMPRYDRQFFQLQKRPSGNGLDVEGGPYGSPSTGNNLASYNEWRKITENQIGKTFGMTGSYLRTGGVISLGHGVTFPSGTGAGAAITGDTVEITMGYRTEGDIGAGFIHPVSDLVEAFQYEVIKGTTVDGTFIPVWKKTRTI